MGFIQKQCKLVTMSGRKKFGKGALLVEPIGENPADSIWYRITHRDGDWAVIKQCQTVQENGKWVAGPADPFTRSFRRKLRKSDGHERGFSVVHPSMGWVGWARVPERRGGKRRGAGRPKGTLRGRDAKSVTVSMSTFDWAMIDKMRGKTPRGKYLAKIHEEFLLRNNSTNPDNTLKPPKDPLPDA